MFFLSETEEGFIKLFSKPINDVSEGEITPSEEKKEIIAKDDNTPPTGPENIHNLRLLLKVSYLLPTLNRKEKSKSQIINKLYTFTFEHFTGMACIVQMLYAYVYISYMKLCVSMLILRKG